MNEQETLDLIHKMGYRGMLGLLRAKREGIITHDEYRELKDYAVNTLGVGEKWWRKYVWSG